MNAMIRLVRTQEIIDGYLRTHPVPVSRQLDHIREAKVNFRGYGCWER